MVAYKGEDPSMQGVTVEGDNLLTNKPPHWHANG
jgi:hypothetical protein